MSSKRTFLGSLGSLAVDCFCIFSLVGIWPRYIEPKRLKKTLIKTSLKGLKGLKIIQFSDLHFHEKSSISYLKKVNEAIRAESADLIVFTGDFLCYSNLQRKEELKEFLSSMKAPLGKYCIFGNHDYAGYVSRTLSGDYQVLKPAHPLGGLLRGIRTLFSKNKIGRVTQEVKNIHHHEELTGLLKECDFKILENETVQPCGKLNLTGLGDYALGRFDPEVAYKGYQKDLTGIVLSHNPDTIIHLEKYPGEIILLGHTHGEQIHFPFPLLRKLSKKLTRLERTEYTRGLYQEKRRTIYVNRGIGCHKPIRFLSPPEILILEIE